MITMDKFFVLLCLFSTFLLYTSPPRILIQRRMGNLCKAEEIAIMMKRAFCLALLLLSLPFAAFAEPGWNSVKEILRKDFPSRVNCPAEDITQIEDAKATYYWKDKEYFPALSMFSYPGWVYYKGELPGEIRRQKIIANYKLIAGNWQFDSCGVPVRGGNDQVTPAAKLPPLPTPPSIDTVKNKYIEYLKAKYSDGTELLDLSITKFDTAANLSHVKNSDGSYASVSFEANAKIEFTATIKDGGRYQKITGKGPATLMAQTSKEPAAEWYKSTEVKEWNIHVMEDPTKFSHDYENIEEPTKGIPSAPSLPKSVKGLKNFFN
jgi:hypothetical protein